MKNTIGTTMSSTVALHCHRTSIGVSEVLKLWNVGSLGTKEKIEIYIGVFKVKYLRTHYSNIPALQLSSFYFSIMFRTHPFKMGPKAGMPGVAFAKARPSGPDSSR